MKAEEDRFRHAVSIYTLFLRSYKRMTRKPRNKGFNPREQPRRTQKTYRVTSKLLKQVEEYMIKLHSERKKKEY